MVKLPCLRHPAFLGFLAIALALSEMATLVPASQR